MAKSFNGAKRDAWRRRLAKFDASGLTVVDFCRREQVSQASFYYWSKRSPGRDRSTTGGRPRSDAGTKISTGAARNEQGSGCVEVLVGDTICVRMPAGDPAAVAALVNQLQRILKLSLLAYSTRPIVSRRVKDFL